MKIAILYMTGVNSDSTSKLRQHCQSISQLSKSQGVKSVTLAIDSGGGKMPESRIQATLLKSMGLPLTAHNIANVESAAMELFAIADVRLATPQARFLMHDVNWKINETLTRVQLQEKAMIAQSDFEFQARTLSKACEKSFDEVCRDMELSLLLDAKQAVGYGLVHDIVEFVNDFDVVYEVV